MGMKELGFHSIRKGCRKQEGGSLLRVSSSKSNGTSDARAGPRVYKELWWVDQVLGPSRPRTQQGCQTKARKGPKAGSGCEAQGMQGNEKVDIQVTDLGSYLEERAE